MRLTNRYRYEEEIGLHPIVKFSYLAMLLVFVVVGLRGEASGPPFFVLALVGVALLSIPLLFGRLVIQVREAAVEIRFGYLGWPGRVIPLEDIEKTEAITYRPLRQFGGWGIRCGRFQGQFTGCYSIKTGTVRDGSIASTAGLKRSRCPT